VNENESDPERIRRLERELTKSRRDCEHYRELLRSVLMRHPGGKEEAEFLCAPIGESIADIIAEFERKLKPDG
jgi:hypothetical protein